MKVVRFSDFRNNLAGNLNQVNNDGDILIVSCTKRKNVVIMSLDEYNSIQETLYLNSSKTNRDRLESAISEMKREKFSKP